MVVFVSLRLGPKQRKDLNIFDKSKFESLWVAGRCNFSNNCRSKKPLNVTYNPCKANQIKFFEKLLSNIDNSTCEMLPITMMEDYDLDFLRTLERENLEILILPYDVSVAGPYLPTRIFETTKTHIDYFLTESIPD